MKYIFLFLIPLCFARATEKSEPINPLDGCLESESALPSRAKRIYALERCQAFDPKLIDQSDHLGPLRSL